MSPAQLWFAMRVLREHDRLERVGMAKAVMFAISASLGGEVDWKDL